MITRQQLIDRCLENEDKKFTDGDFTFRLFKGHEEQQLWHVEARTENSVFNLWDHLKENDWYIDSFHITKDTAQKQFDDYVKFLNYLEIEYNFQLPEKEKIVEKIVIRRDVEKEKFLEGKLEVYERLLQPFKNLSV